MALMSRLPSPAAIAALCVARFTTAWSILAATRAASPRIRSRSLAPRSRLNATGVSSGCSKAARL